MSDRIWTCPKCGGLKSNLWKHKCTFTGEVEPKKTLFDELQEVRDAMDKFRDALIEALQINKILKHWLDKGRGG